YLKYREDLAIDDPSHTTHTFSIPFYMHADLTSKDQYINNLKPGIGFGCYDGGSPHPDNISLPSLTSYLAIIDNVLTTYDYTGWPRWKEDQYVVPTPTTSDLNVLWIYPTQDANLVWVDVNKV